MVRTCPLVTMTAGIFAAAAPAASASIRSPTYEHVAGVELPARARGQKTARARLERADLRIAAAQHDREVVADAERVELLLRRIVGEDAHLHAARGQKLEQVHEPARTAAREILQRPLDHPLVHNGGRLAGRDAGARRGHFKLTRGIRALAAAQAFLGLAIGRERPPDGRRAPRVRQRKDAKLRRHQQPKRPLPI